MVMEYRVVPVSPLHVVIIVGIFRRDRATDHRGAAHRLRVRRGKPTVAGSNGRGR